jgi:hypothetical protein
VLNLGVEGMMLVGAVIGFWGGQHTGSLAAAVTVAAIAGAVGPHPRIPRHHVARQSDRPGWR